MNKINLKTEHFELLKKIFTEYCPNAEIYVFGSRLNGDSHEGSDLDIVVKSFGNDKSNLAELKQLLNNSNIPFLIDIFELDKLPLTFQKEIENSFVKIYPV